MKRILFFVFLPFIVFGQNLKVETQYLKIVNRQNNKFLIKDNLRNSELTVDSLMYVARKGDTLAADFFVALSESYFKTGKIDMALYTILRQRCLFPCKLADRQTALLTERYCKTNKYEEILSATNYDAVNGLKISDRLAFLFHKSSLLKSKKVSVNLIKIIKLYSVANYSMSKGVAQWYFLTVSGISPKKINNFIDWQATGYYDKQSLFDGMQLPSKINKRLNRTQ